MFKDRRNFLIYLAIPYSGIEDKSFEISSKVSAALLKKGYNVISPVVLGHVIAEQNNLMLDHDDWYDIDLAILRRCDMLLVLTIAGWENSKGVQLEIEEAKKFGMPILYVYPDYYLNDNV